LFNGSAESADQKITGKFKEILSNNLPKDQTTVVNLRLSSAEGFTAHCNLELVRRDDSSGTNEAKARAANCEANVRFQCERQYKAGSNNNRMQYDLTLTDQPHN
jgi:hypothetical protein